MKKLLIVLFVLCIYLTGCTNTSTDVSKNNTSNQANATWDCVEYNNIDEMNNAAGTNIVSAGIAGKSDEWFGVISKSIAQYKFTVGDEEWCIRASKDTDNDISGLYYDNISFEKDVTSTYYNDEVYMFRFFYKDVQYVISLKTAGKDVPTTHFDEICNELKTNITGIKSGYDIELIENEDDVVYRTTSYDDNGLVVVTDVIYKFENDRIISIENNITFENDDAAKAYYDLLIQNGLSKDELKLNGSVIEMDMSDNVDTYKDYTRDSFIEQMRTILALD